MVSADAPASAAIDAIVVVAYPSCRNRLRAAAMIASRVSRACSRRRLAS
jgi:hypothetical protein